MVARTRTVIKSDEGFMHRWEVGEVEVSHDDTVTLSEHDSGQNLLNQLVIAKNGGATVVAAIANNVLTIDPGEGTNVDCFYFVYGYKA